MGYNCVFPDGRDIAVVESEVEKVGEILKTKGCKVFEVMYSKGNSLVQRQENCHCFE